MMSAQVLVEGSTCTVSSPLSLISGAMETARKGTKDFVGRARKGGSLIEQTYVEQVIVGRTRLDLARLLVDFFEFGGRHRVVAFPVLVLLFEMNLGGRELRSKR